MSSIEQIDHKTTSLSRDLESLKRRVKSIEALLQEKEIMPVPEKKKKSSGGAKKRDGVKAASVPKNPETSTQLTTKEYERRSRHKNSKIHTRLFGHRNEL
jgi:hypothetical protein